MKEKNPRYYLSKKKKRMEIMWALSLHTYWCENLSRENYNYKTKSFLDWRRCVWGAMEVKLVFTTGTECSVLGLNFIISTEHLRGEKR